MAALAAPAVDAVIVGQVNYGEGLLLTSDPQQCLLLQPHHAAPVHGVLLTNMPV
jgi:hypothetical protein